MRVALGIAKWAKLNSVCVVNSVDTTAGALHTKMLASPTCFSAHCWNMEEVLGRKPCHLLIEGTTEYRMWPPLSLRYVALTPQSDIALLFRCGVSQQKTGKFGQAHCGHQQEGGLYDDKNRKRLQKHRDLLQAGPGVWRNHSRQQKNQGNV